MNLKIKDVKVHVVGLPAPKGGALPAAGQHSKFYLGVVRVISSDGLEGHALVGSILTASPRSIVHMAESVKPFLVGQDALDRESLWHQMRRMSPRGDASGEATVVEMDVALWDLAAKAANVPLYKLLGAYRHKIPTFASGPYHAEVEATVEEALSCKERGLLGYKIHHAVPDLRRVVSVCTKVRQAVGDDMALMFDYMSRYTFEEALYVGQALDELRYRWYEDPLPPQALDGLAELSRRLVTPIAISDARDFRFADAPLAISKGAARILRTDPPKDGITGMRKMAALCEAHNLGVEFHDGGNFFMDVAVLHVALSVKNTTSFSWVIRSQAATFGLAENVKVDSEGYVQAPSKPGLGIDIDWALVERYTEAVL